MHTNKIQTDGLHNTQKRWKLFQSLSVHNNFQVFLSTISYTASYLATWVILNIQGEMQSLSYFFLNICQNELYKIILYNKYIRHWQVPFHWNTKFGKKNHWFWDVKWYLLHNKKIIMHFTLKLLQFLAKMSVLISYSLI